jgi:tRNA-uridine 2-sulfurtransferase
MPSPKAVVAMSGGVDSSVAAALLVEAGYDVTGIMLKLWRGEEINHASGCCNLGAADDARRVADVLGIPFYVLNYADRFEASVVADFKSNYTGGRTPNPCVRCNQWIKFDALLDKATALGADVLATGHYARVRAVEGRYRLLRGADARKDQSYVLWMLTQDELRRCSFPVGEMEKSETRRIASSLGLRTARKPDSQEICFVRGGDFDAYVDEHLQDASAPGPIVDMSGALVGEHRGIGRYTVGQRKRLGISLGMPVFVTSIDAASNTLVVGGRTELAVGGFVVEEASFTDRVPEDGADVLVQHRAHGDVNAGRLRNVDGGRFVVEYRSPVEAVSPGQSAALYSGVSSDELLGGGIIASTIAVGADV